jgi:hypothetical protein
MKINQLLLVFITILSVESIFGQEKKFKIHTIAFYNIENLFDNKDDPTIND